MTDRNPDSWHLPAEAMAAFVTGGLDRGSRARIQLHLADCPDCRAEAVAVRRVVAAHGRDRIRRHVIRAGVGAAAVFALVLALRPVATDRSSPRTRGPLPAAPGLANLVPVAPLGEVDAAGAPLAFAWRPVPAALEYHLTITDREGRVLWARDTRDTTLVPPVEMVLARGLPYYWLVDALLPDGESVTTGSREFRLRR